MTADEARRIEGMFGRIEVNGEKNNYPLSLHGTVLICDSYTMIFKSQFEKVHNFSLKKVKSFYMKPKKKIFLWTPKKSKLFRKFGS